MSSKEMMMPVIFFFILAVLLQAAATNCNDVTIDGTCQVDVMALKKASFAFFVIALLCVFPLGAKQ